MSDSALKKAVKNMGVGAQSKLAEQLGCTPQYVQKMCATGHVPERRVLTVESLTGVSRYILRPDIFKTEACRT